MAKPYHRSPLAPSGTGFRHMTNGVEDIVAIPGEVSGSVAAETAARIAADAGKQPLDSNLTAIAALATQAYGRSFLECVNAAAAILVLGLGTAASLASDTDGTLAANSDTRIPTQKAIKTYVDGAVTGLWDWKGGQACAANPNYPAAAKGDAYSVTSAGKIGGASGTSVDVGDVFVASADNAGGTEASVGASWVHIEHNLVGALLSANNLSDITSQSAARGNLGSTTVGDALFIAITAAAARSALGLATVAASGGAADLTGTLAAARLPATAVTAATYGDASHVPQFTVDAAGRLTAASNVAISGGGGSGLIVQAAWASDATQRSTSSNSLVDSSWSIALGSTLASISSKVRIRLVMQIYAAGGAVTMGISLKRGTTDLTPAGGTISKFSIASGFVIQIVLEWVDSPASTAINTYHVWWKTQSGLLIQNYVTSGGDVGVGTLAIEELSA